MSKAKAIFAKSVESIKANRSTGNELLDTLGTKVLYGIHEGKLTFTESEGSYKGQLGKAMVSVRKEAKGKVNRIILDVAGTEITGEFAARAFKMAHASLNKKGRSTIEVDEEKVASVLDLLD